MTGQNQGYGSMSFYINPDTTFLRDGSGFGGGFLKSFFLNDRKKSFSNQMANFFKFKAEYLERTKSFNNFFELLKNIVGSRTRIPDFLWIRIILQTDSIGSAALEEKRPL